MWGCSSHKTQCVSSLIISNMQWKSQYLLVWITEMFLFAETFRLTEKSLQAFAPRQLQVLYCHWSWTKLIWHIHLRHVCLTFHCCLKMTFMMSEYSLIFLCFLMKYSPCTDRCPSRQFWRNVTLHSSSQVTSSFSYSSFLAHAFMSDTELCAIVMVTSFVILK